MAIDQTTIMTKTNKDMIISYVNDEFCKISKYTRDEIIGKPHQILKHPDVSKDDFDHIWEILKTKKLWKGIAFLHHIPYTYR